MWYSGSKSRTRMLPTITMTSPSTRRRDPLRAFSKKILIYFFLYLTAQDLVKLPQERLKSVVLLYG